MKLNTLYFFQYKYIYIIIITSVLFDKFFIYVSMTQCFNNVYLRRKS